VRHNSNISIKNINIIEKTPATSTMRTAISAAEISIALTTSLRYYNLRNRTH